MGLFLVYILKSSVCLAVYYLFYRLLLSRDTFHRFNRFALLGILLFSCLLPLVEVSVGHSEAGQVMLTLEQLLMMADLSAVSQTETPVQAATSVWLRGLALVYLAGIGFFFCRNLYSLWQLLCLLRSGRREALEHYGVAGKGVTLVVHDRSMAPFSWMRYVVVSRCDLEENGQAILLHELAHIRNRHSLDLLVADICIFFLWFNPASWLLKQELQNIHEYEADETVIRKGVDAKRYQLLLIKKAVGTRLYSMANSFNHSNLKKRITMMLKEKSNPWARLKYLYVLPLAVGTVTAFARPEVSETTSGIAAVKVSDLAAIVETKVAENVSADTVVPRYTPQLVGEKGKVKASGSQQEGKGTVYDVVDEMPSFPGGMTAMMEFLRDNVRYPESAQKAGAQGRVVVQYIVDREGNICDPKVIYGVEPSLDAEAVRVITIMPRWEPGKLKGEAVATKFTIPVMFRLNDDKTKTAETPKTPEGSALTDWKQMKGSMGNVQFVVNGQVVDEDIMSALNPKKIAGIEVLKDPASLEKYKATGKDAILMITLKDSATDALAAGEQRSEGKVVDEQGNPVIGACILIEGTTRGTVTDKEGRFTLVVPSEDAMLVVSYIGMESTKVKVQSKMTIVLKDE